MRVISPETYLIRTRRRKLTYFHSGSCCAHPPTPPSHFTPHNVSQQRAPGCRFEIVSGNALPGSGDLWDLLRSGGVPPPGSCSAPLGALITAMMHPNPADRPSAQDTLMAVATALQANAVAQACACVNAPWPTIPRNVSTAAS